MIIHNVEQGSEEWFQIRLGLPTASRFSDIVTPAKCELSKSRHKYLYELVAEKLIKERECNFSNEWLERGNELENEARQMYQLLTDNGVKEVGIITDDDIKVGASPDGLIGEAGGLEIKCPKASTLVKYYIKDELPLEYKLQVMGNLWLSGREWWDFFAYHPKVKPFYKRVYRDEKCIKKLKEFILPFADDVISAYEKVR